MAGSRGGSQGRSGQLPKTPQNVQNANVNTRQVSGVPTANKQYGLTPDDLIDFQNYYAQESKNILGSPMSMAEWAKMNRRGDFRSAAEKEDTAAADAEKTRAAQVRASLDAFAKEMSQELDMNDPKVQRIMQDIRGKVTSDSSLRGMGGEGLAASAEQAALLDTRLKLDDSRQQKAMQAMNMQLADVGQQKMLREHQYDQGMASAQQQYEANKAQNQGMWSAIGGIGGGIIGGLATGGVAGIAPGAALGSGLAGGLAGSNYGPPPRYGQQRYSGGMSGPSNRGGF